MIPREVPVILDAKRGNIGTTSDAYAHACLGAATGPHPGLDAHAVTVSPYMGGDSLAPFLRDSSKGVFILCKTSNPGSTDMQVCDDFLQNYPHPVSSLPPIPLSRVD